MKIRNEEEEQTVRGRTVEEQKMSTRGGQEEESRKRQRGAKEEERKEDEHYQTDQCNVLKKGKRKRRG